MSAYADNGVVSQYERPTGEKVVITFDRATKTMTVAIDGEVVREERIPRIGFRARVDWALAYKAEDFTAYEALKADANG